MRQVAAVAWREIVEHRVFVWAAFAALAVTLVVPLIPAYVGWSPADIRQVLMWGMALCFTWVGAAFLGAAMINRPVAEGRIGFFMSRPVSGAAVWFGKLLGVAVVLVVCELIVLVPAALLTDPEGIGRHIYDIYGWLGVVLTVPLLIVLLTHAIGTAWQGKSAWIALDLVAVAVAGVVGWTIVDRLLSAGAVGAALVVVLLLVSATVAAILIGGWLQVSRGRCDGRRQHRFFSLVAWPVLLAMVGGVSVYGCWLTRPGVDDLKYVDGDLVVHPGGDWITVDGPARGRIDVNAQFLLNLSTDESARIGVGLRWFGPPLSAVSLERRAAWFVPEQDGWSLYSGSLDEVSMGGERSTIFVRTEPRFTLSSRGDRVAMIEEDLLVVSTLPAGNLLGSAKLAEDRFHLGPYFRSDDRVWVVESQASRDKDAPPPVKLLEFDIASQQIREVGVLTDGGTAFSAAVDIERERVLLGTAFKGQRRWKYLDALTFTEIPWSAETNLGPVVSMLADGRLVRFSGLEERSAIEVLSPDGVTVARVHLPPGLRLQTFGLQPTSSSLVIVVGEEDAGYWWYWWVEASQTLLVDFEANTTQEIARGAIPLTWKYNLLGLVTPLPAGCPSSRVFVSGFGISEKLELQRWNPDTGDLEPIVPARK